jgi:hypothetical protein
MNEQKGSGLIVVLITVLLVALIFFGLFARPKDNDVSVEGYDPSKSIIEQRDSLINEATGAKNALEEKNREEVSE